MLIDVYKYICIYFSYIIMICHKFRQGGGIKNRSERNKARKADGVGKARIEIDNVNSVDVGTVKTTRRVRGQRNEKIQRDH